MNIKTTLKTSVATAALFAIAAPVATTAEAADDTFKTGNKNSVTMSGYVSKMIVYADDGEESHTFLTDGQTTESRLRWVAQGTLNENVTAGAMIELEIPLSNDSSGAALTTTGGETDADTTLWGIRHQYVWVNHKKFGKVSLGNTNAAGNGSAEADLSGTTWIALSGGLAGISSLTFVSEGQAANPGVKSRSAVTIGGATGVTDNKDATSRTDVLRYDTPKFGGFGLAASINGAGGGEVGATYSGKHGPVKVLVKASFSERSSTNSTVDDRIAVSAAAIHDSGINAGIRYGIDTLQTSSAATAEEWFWGGTIGYRAKIFGAGGTDFAFTYYSGHHIAARGDHSENMAFIASQSFDAIGAAVALYYNNHELERANQTYDSIDQIGLQTVFNF